MGWLGATSRIAEPAVPLEMRSERSHTLLPQHDDLAEEDRHVEPKGSNWWRRPRKQEDGSPIFPERPATIILEFYEVQTMDTRIHSRHMAQAELLKTAGLDPGELRTLLLGHLPDALGHSIEVANEPPSGATYRRAASMPERAISSGLKPGASPLLRARGSCLLLRLGDLRAIIDGSCMRLFSLQGGASQNQKCFLDLLQARLRQLKGNLEPAIFATAVVECALLAISQRLDATVQDAKRAVDPLVHAPLLLREVDLEQVRLHRSQLQQGASLATTISSALLHCVSEPHTLLPHTMASGTEEFEGMLEAYLHAYGQCSRECKEFLHSVESIEATMTLALQARRLHIEEFELMLIIGSVALSTGALIPGVFGMNLLNTYESSNFHFKLTIGLTVFVLVSLFMCLRWLAMYRGVFSSQSRKWTKQLFEGSGVGLG
mmetsp:Transcript_32942/g.60286  ORF Transcript_32942/g.60286 Transcript_32942/m.60286 type:complete len:433 (-) Transcript_32942:78-1376(-)